MTTAPLPAHVLELIERAVSHCSPEIASTVTRQASKALLVSETAGRRLDVSVPMNSVLIPAPNGPLRPIPGVETITGESTGELMVWVRDGLLIGLERPWWTDEAPDEWPGVEDLRFD